MKNFGLKQCCIFLFVLLLISSSALSSDSDRKGYVGGFGIGYSPYANWDVGFVPSETNTGTAFKLLFGYGINETNVLAIELLGIGTYSEELNNTLILQIINSFRWYHFYQMSPDVAFYSSIGAGSLGFGSEFSNVGGFGLGIHLGGGIEFKRHYQLDLNYIFGSTSETGNLDADHKLFSVLLTVMAF